ncbi:MAG: alpha/beta fold hydrolase [Erysipelotrichaceae bacterium]|nr:alpha/beta fold hydrolase [Erysipelotrichaceae bacterium]
MKKIINFKSSDNKTDIHVVYYIPDGEIKMILQISHGMAEFFERYEKFALYLNERGILVVGNDHLGHGYSINSKDDYGHQDSKDGYLNILSDLHTVMEMTKKEYPGIPYYFMGHSMGSFYTRLFISKYSKDLDGVIIMGTAFMSNVVVNSGILLCNILLLFKDKRYRSKLITSIATGSYNKKWEPSATHNDWLTKDEKIVDWYSNEERCTFTFTLYGYLNMFKTLREIHTDKCVNGIRRDLPLLIVSGDDDPVGDYGKGPKKLYEVYREKGFKDVELKLYENDRHEILNELDKEDVYEYLYQWLIKQHR